MLRPGPRGATLECQAFGAGGDGQPLPHRQGRVGQELRGLIASGV